MAGSLSAVEGDVRGAVALRGCGFAALWGGLGGVELETDYSHVRGLDEWGLGASLSWQRRWGGSSVYPYLALGGGWRQEWLGSFAEARFPLGAALGARALAGERAVVRVEYRVRRVTHDPVADFTEQQAWLGISLLFRNRARAEGPGGGERGGD